MQFNQVNQQQVCSEPSYLYVQHGVRCPMHGGISVMFSEFVGVHGCFVGIARYGSVIPSGGRLTSVEAHQKSHTRDKVNF